MRAVDWLKGIFAPKKRTITLSDVMGELYASENSSGNHATPENAMTWTTIYGSVRILSETYGQIPWGVFERLSGFDKRPAPEHPAHPLLAHKPNPYITSFNFREMWKAHELLWGNSYAEIEWNNAGEVRALWPIHPRRVRPFWVTGKQRSIAYEVRIGETEVVYLPYESMLHVPGMGFDGLQGFSRISMLKKAIENGMNADDFASDFYEKGSMLQGAFVHPEELADEAYKRLQNNIKKSQGLKGKRVMLLEEGLNWQQIGVSQQDAQFIETRKFQGTDVASAVFGVPPHLLGQLENAHYNNLEHQQIEFVTYTMVPHFVRTEQVVNDKLVDPEKTGRFYNKLNEKGLLRGDQKTRYEAYALGRNWGWLSANDIRRLEDLNSIGPGGDEYMVPLNMVPAGSALRSAPSNGKGAIDVTPRHKALLTGLQEDRFGRGQLVRSRRSMQARISLREAFFPIFVDTANRLVAREIKVLREQSDKRLRKLRSQDDWEEWLRGYYNDEVPRIAYEMFRALFESYGLEIAKQAWQEIGIEANDLYKASMIRHLDDVCRGFARTHSIISLNQMLQLEGDPEEVETRLDNWEHENSRANKIAKKETVKLDGDAAERAWMEAGIEYKMWQNWGETTCEYCEEMDGIIVAIGENFLEDGQGVRPEGKSEMLPRKAVKFPPLHGTCDCSLVPITTY